MSPEKLDTLIFAALSEGGCALPELAERTGQDARSILKRLHVLGGLGYVRSSGEGGRVLWFSKRDVPRSKEVRESRSAPALEAQPVAAIQESPAPAPEQPVDAPEAQPEPAARAASLRGHEMRRKCQSIVVRPPKRVLEISVRPLNGGDVIISVENDDPKSEPDEVFVDAADIPALIAALNEVRERFA